MRVENLLDFNKIIPQKWKSVCQNINITGYQTISNFDDYSGITITGDNIIIFFLFWRTNL